MTARSRRLRVAFVHLSDYHLDGEVQRPARALAARGDEVHAIGIGRAAVLSEGKGTIVVHEARLRRSRGGARAYLSEYVRFLTRATATVTRLHARAPFDFVQVHNMPDALVFAGVVPKLAGRPVVLQLNDTFPELFRTLTGRSARSPVWRLIALEERASAWMADMLIAVTPHAGARFNARGVGVGKTTIMINAPNEAVFGAPRAVEVAFEAAALRLVYHGGLAERYGVESLLRALPLVRRHLPRATLDVYSQMATGPEAARLRAIAPQGATIHTEPIDHRDVPVVLERADVGVVPTVLDDFTRLLLPVKLMEYVHMALPVVASDLPIVRETFGPDALELVPPGDSSALAAGVLRIARDPARAAARARLATERLQPLAWREQVDRYTALVDELVHVSRSGAARKRQVRANRAG